MSPKIPAEPKKPVKLLDEETLGLLKSLVYNIRCIAHGDMGPGSSPGGLEALAMSLNGEEPTHGRNVSRSLCEIAEAITSAGDINGLVDSVDSIATSIDDVASANTKIADAINNLADAVREHGATPVRNLP